VIEIPTALVVMMPGFFAAACLALLRVPEKHRQLVSISIAMLALGSMAGMLGGKLLSSPQQQASVETPQEVRDESVQEYLASAVSVPDPDPEPESLADSSNSSVRGWERGVRDPAALRRLGDLRRYGDSDTGRSGTGSDPERASEPDQGRNSERQSDNTRYDLPRTTGEQPGPWRIERKPGREWSERR
jgi:hypothetical protein